MLKTIVDPHFAYWDDVSQRLLHCRCGTSFRGRAKFTYRGGKAIKIIDRWCPQCGDKTEIVRTKSDPETFTLRGG